jgi:exonuclease SbcC
VHRGLLGNTDVIQTIEDWIAKIVIPDDRTGDLERRRAYDAELGQYEADQVAYERYNDGLAEKQGRFEALQSVPTTIAGLRKLVSDAKVYEGLLKQFNNQVRHYESNLIEYNRMTADAGHYASAQETIRGLKIAIKSMLLHSLNKVASHILGQMSGGERYQVEIDDDFNIEIDGLPINTLSGSGKAVANLAIRIALGQILTNRVFSLFMADEVDASMDDDRAASTAESLRRLTDSVTQVVLVTHKSPSTDHLIELA